MFFAPRETVPRLNPPPGGGGLEIASLNEITGLVHITFKLIGF